MKAKVEQLRKLMEKYELFQENDEVGIALKELETEINSYEEYELYNEDFADGSLELEVLYNNDRNINSINILFKNESNS
jgi:hypothetical protein